MKQLTRHGIVLDHELLGDVEWFKEGASFHRSKVARPVSKASMVGKIIYFAAFLVLRSIRNKLGKETLISAVFGSKVSVTVMSRDELAHNRVKHQNQSYQKEAKVGSASRSSSHLARRLSRS